MKKTRLSRFSFRAIVLMISIILIALVMAGMYRMRNVGKNERKGPRVWTSAPQVRKQASVRKAPILTPSPTTRFPKQKAPTATADQTVRRETLKPVAKAVSVVDFLSVDAAAGSAGDDPRAREMRNKALGAALLDPNGGWFSDEERSDFAAVHASTTPSNISSIPKLIAQVGLQSHIPLTISKRMRELVQSNPEYTHYYFDHQTARDFIEKKFGHRHVAAFDAVVPYRYKEDLFKYCWLVENGGVVVDIGVDLKQPLSSILRDVQDSSLYMIMGASDLTFKFVAAEARSWVLQRTLDIAVRRITDRRAVNCAECLTGGMLLEAVVNKTSGSSQAGNISLMSVESFDQFAAVRGDVYKQSHSEMWAVSKIYKEVDAKEVIQEVCSNAQKGQGGTSDIAPFRKRHRTLEGTRHIPYSILMSGGSFQVAQQYRMDIDKLQAVNDDHSFFFFDARMKDDYIVEHFKRQSTIAKAYFSLREERNRDEFFRYCWLYLHGGVYIDSSYQAVTPIHQIIQPTDELVVVEHGGMVGRMMLAAAPSHFVLERAITLAAKRILARRLGYDDHSLTGGTLLREAFEGVLGVSVMSKIGGVNKPTRVLRTVQQTDPCNISIVISPYEVDDPLVSSPGSKHGRIIGVSLEKIPHAHSAEAFISKASRGSIEGSYQRTALINHNTRIGVVAVNQSSEGLPASLPPRVLLATHAFDSDPDTFIFVPPTITDAAEPDLAWLDFELAVPMALGRPVSGRKELSLSCVRLVLPREITSEIVSNPTLLLRTEAGEFIMSVSAENNLRAEVFFDLRGVSSPDFVKALRLQARRTAIAVGEIELITGDTCNQAFKLEDARPVSSHPLVENLHGSITIAKARGCKVIAGGRFRVCPPKSGMMFPESCSVVSVGDGFDKELLFLADKGCQVTAYNANNTFDHGNIVQRVMQTRKKRKIGPLIYGANIQVVDYLLINTSSLISDDTRVIFDEIIQLAKSGAIKNFLTQLKIGSTTTSRGTEVSPADGAQWLAELHKFKTAFSLSGATPAKGIPWNKVGSQIFPALFDVVLSSR